MRKYLNILIFYIIKLFQIILALGDSTKATLQYVNRRLYECTDFLLERTGKAGVVLRWPTRAHEQRRSRSYQSISLSNSLPSFEEFRMYQELLMVFKTS